jgi:DNA-binding FadR family transcriptional regulator
MSSSQTSPTGNVDQPEGSSVKERIASTLRSIRQSFRHPTIVDLEQKANLLNQELMAAKELAASYKEDSAFWRELANSSQREVLNQIGQRVSALEG